ncbi:MAG: hypothetical protein C0412_15095, partial [Flavobacterium sp.]|nr:hypothetical protein [Flavobacterium sp.]
MLNRRYINIISVFVILVLHQTIFAQKGRAMWVWNSSNEVNNIINNYSSYRKDLFKFCMNPHNNAKNKISVLFLSSRDAVYSNSDNLRKFIAEASDSGITIEYLDGDPSWATYNQATGYDRISKVIEFNSKTISEKEKIKGVHFDVEPYLMKQGGIYKPPFWDVDRTTVWNSYVAFLDSCQSLVNNSGSNMYFGIAIPRWYENHVGVNELKKLQSKVDYVAIMDYNENASVIINDASNEIKHAVELNKKVWIGVETQQISPETVSFYEEGNNFMETQLDSTFKVYGGHSVFLGFAIHSYRTYRVLSQNPLSVKKNDFSKNTSFVLDQNYPNPFNP